MLDQAVRRVIDPTLNWAARNLARWKIKANHVTLLGFGFGVVAVIMIANQSYYLGLGFILLNRLLDGLDGALARATHPTDLGGYLDIVLDFLFYGGVVLAFALAEIDYAIAASFLLFSFIGTGTTFLTFAIFAAKHRLHPAKAQHKAFIYLGGLTEGTETLLFFVIVCLWPGYFPAAAYLFGALCWVTVATRIWSAWSALAGPRGAEFSGD
jgi:phosphatidylglycerophosphate synthase